MRMSIVCGALMTFATTSAWADDPPADGTQDTPSNYRVVERIAGPDGPWDFSIVDEDRRRLFVARGNGVMMVDLSDNDVTPVFAPGARVHDVVLLGSGKLLSTNGDLDTATIIDEDSGEVLATIATGSKPDAAVFDLASGLAYVMNAKSGDATIIDPRAAKSIGTIPIGGALEFAAVDGEGRMFVNVEDKNEIAVVDLTRKAVVGRYKLDGCEGPSGLAYVSSARVLIAACGNGVAKAVDARSGVNLATLKIGPRPDDVLYDQRRHLAFVPSGGDGTLTVIAVGDRSNISVVASVVTQTGARIGALDGESGRIYLPAAKYTPATTPGGRPTAVPGSFEILVLEP